MKDLLITRNFGNRGGNIVFSNVARELIRRKYDIDIVAFHERGFPSIEPGAESLWRDLKVRSVEIQHFENSSRQILEYIVQVRDFLQNNHNKYDRVIIDSWYVMYSSVIANVVGDKVWQLVQSDPEFVPETDESIFKSELFRSLEYLQFNQVLVSKSLARKLELRTKREYPCIDIFIDDIFHKTKYQVRENDDSMKIVASAIDFNNPDKGLPELIEVLDKLNKVVRVELLLLTKAPLSLPVVSFPINTYFASTREGVVDKLLGCDVFVSASKKEAFGLSIAEAVTLGLPTVAFDATGNKDFYNGNNYILVHGNDEMYEGLKLLANKDERVKLSVNGKSSMSRYTLEKTVDQFVKLVFK